MNRAGWLVVSREVSVPCKAFLPQPLTLHLSLGIWGRPGLASVLAGASRFVHRTFWSVDGLAPCWVLVRSSVSGQVGKAGVGCRLVVKGVQPHTCATVKKALDFSGFLQKHHQVWAA